MSRVNRRVELPAPALVQDRAENYSPGSLVACAIGMCDARDWVRANLFFVHLELYRRCTGGLVYVDADRVVQPGVANTVYESTESSCFTTSPQDHR